MARQMCVDFLLLFPRAKGERGFPSRMGEAFAADPTRQLTTTLRALGAECTSPLHPSSSSGTRPSANNAWPRACLLTERIELSYVRQQFWLRCLPFQK